jgi:hypothetical protein
LTNRSGSVYNQDAGDAAARKKKGKYGLNAWITSAIEVGYNSYGPVFCGYISVLNSLKLPNSQ